VDDLVLDLVLELPTGALIAGDAATVFADARPLVEGLPAGRFPARLDGVGLEVRLGEGEPAQWSELPAFATPSGYAALLDAASLADYTDLGDEPVDEFELLSERFGTEEAALFRDVLALRGETASAALRLGRDAAGAVCRISLRFIAGARAADGR
jgi:hypothetical protein